MKKISTNRFLAFLLALLLVGGHLCHPAFFPAARAADAMTIRNVTEQSDVRVWVRFNNRVDQVNDENSTRTDSLVSRGHIEGFAIVDANGDLMSADGVVARWDSPFGSKSGFVEFNTSPNLWWIEFNPGESPAFECQTISDVLALTRPGARFEGGQVVVFFEDLHHTDAKRTELYNNGKIDGLLDRDNGWASVSANKKGGWSGNGPDVLYAAINPTATSFAVSDWSSNQGIVTFSEPVWVDPNAFKAMRILDNITSQTLLRPSTTGLANKNGWYLHWTGGIASVTDESAQFFSSGGKTYSTRWIFTLNGGTTMQQIKDLVDQGGFYEGTQLSFCLEELPATPSNGGTITGKIKGVMEHVLTSDGRPAATTKDSNNGNYDDIYLPVFRVDKDTTPLTIKEVRYYDENHLYIGFSAPYVVNTAGIVIKLQILDGAGNVVENGSGMTSITRDENNIYLVNKFGLYVVIRGSQSAYYQSAIEALFAEHPEYSLRLCILDRNETGNISGTVGDGYVNLCYDYYYNGAGYSSMYSDDTARFLKADTPVTYNGTAYEAATCKVTLPSEMVRFESATRLNDEQVLFRFSEPVGNDAQYRFYLYAVDKATGEEIKAVSQKDFTGLYYQWHNGVGISDLLFGKLSGESTFSQFEAAVQAAGYAAGSYSLRVGLEEVATNIRQTLIPCDGKVEGFWSIATGQRVVPTELGSVGTASQYTNFRPDRATVALEETPRMISAVMIDRLTLQVTFSEPIVKNQLVDGDPAIVAMIRLVDENNALIRYEDNSNWAQLGGTFAPTEDASVWTFTIPNVDRGGLSKLVNLIDSSDYYRNKRITFAVENSGNVPTPSDTNRGYMKQVVYNLTNENGVPLAANNPLAVLNGSTGPDGHLYGWNSGYYCPLVVDPLATGAYLMADNQSVTVCFETPVAIESVTGAKLRAEDGTEISITSAAPVKEQNGYAASFVLTLESAPAESSNLTLILPKDSVVSASGGTAARDHEVALAELTMSVTVTWQGLSFTYDAVWSPASHDYLVANLEDSLESGSAVLVKNSSTIPVLASLSLEKQPGWDGIEYTFSGDSLEVIPAGTERKRKISAAVAQEIHLSQIPTESAKVATLTLTVARPGDASTQ